MPEETRIGRYEILRRIGQGGMGAVYLARDPRLDRQVAIKLLREGLDSEELQERFAREAQLLARLQHPNIVTIYEVGVNAGALYVVMEYVSGQSLSQLIRDRVGMPLHTKLRIMTEVCAGLGHAHQAGLVHRDVKPGNVILSDDGTVKILDFGLARLTAEGSDGELTKAGALFGTPSYMAPEAVEGHRVDQRADVYAAGVLFYELLTFRQPFAGNTLAESLNKVLNVTPSPPSAFIPGLPEGLDTIVGRCLVKNPAERYQEMPAVEADLREYTAGLLDVELRSGTVPSAADDELDSSFQPLLPDAGTRLSLSPSGNSKQATKAETLQDSAATVVRFPDAPPPPAAAPAPDAADGTIALFPVARSHADETADVPDARLIVGRSPDPRQEGRTIPISAAGATLGRSQECEIVITDLRLSRCHARIECADTGFTIRDLGSANGTFVNGRRIAAETAEPLFFGAMIAIGDTLLTFAYGRDTALPDLTGGVLAARYRLERLIRESAKAAVYSAHDGHVPRDVAVKLLSPALSRYAGYREQFAREARTAAQLQHPHVCQVLDSGFGRIDMPETRALETYFLCYELMAGGSLARRLSSEDPPKLADVTRWVGMLGAALQYVHDQGLVHGDLKPTAIVFDAGGHLYLTDFSIAQKAVAEHADRALGSPAFMAPEQWEGSVAAAATDQFAFAALAYLMITGSRPFDGQDHPEIRQKNFRRGPTPAHAEAAQNGRPPVSRAASEVLDRALSVTPSARYPSVDQFSRALVKALGSSRATVAEPLVFVSYDRELSGGWARFFTDRLMTRHAIRVFMDTSNLDRAGRFPPRLTRAIEECDVFICFLAGATLESKWVAEEIRLAHTFGKLMIPVLQESFVEPAIADADEDSPVRALVSHQGIKLFDVSGHFVDHAVADLARMVQDAVHGDADMP